ncbi:MAG: hypothetical protein KKD17_05895 [Nanoarchaeota archaeon]|nr:hypothetical protein [Nanoarchaeota archaeon]
MEQQTDTKQQVTKKFIIGMVLMVSSLVIGKLVIIPLIMLPGSNGLKMSMLIIYITSWIMMLMGIGLAGWEGYRLVTHKYREYKQKTIHQVKHHSKRAAETAVMHTRNAANLTKDVAQKTRQATQKGVDTFKK